MKATFADQVIAESDETLVIEGNHYFPPESVKREYLQDSDHHSTCPWKGEASYYDVVVGDQRAEAAAWYYPETSEAATAKAGGDFRNYVAFWREVKVEE